MRGKVPDRAEEFSDPGITPAYAGKSVRYSKLIRYNLGSPPPMRGKVLCCGHAVHAGGITPAYAGKRSESKL